MSFRSSEFGKIRGRLEELEARIGCILIGLCELEAEIAEAIDELDTAERPVRVEFYGLNSTERRI